MKNYMYDDSPDTSTQYLSSWIYTVQEGSAFEEKRRSPLSS